MGSIATASVDAVKPPGMPVSEHPAYRYFVLALFTLTLMFSVADRLVLSILLQDIKAEFALSDSQLGRWQGSLSPSSMSWRVFRWPGLQIGQTGRRSWLRHWDSGAS